MSKKTVIKQIYDHLKENGIEVYYPSQHKGDCKSKYTVVKGGGAVQMLTVSTERPVYTMMLYVPYTNYSDLEEYKEEVKNIMRGLYPLVQYAGNETSDFYDDSNKSYMASFEYYGVRKIKYFNY